MFVKSNKRVIPKCFIYFIYIHMKEKLDKKGRIIKKEDLISGLVYDYKYEQNKRIVKISLKRCKSKTILTEEKLDEGNDGLDYFINNFGENETYGMVVDNNLIDIDKASQDAVDIDGIAHFISSYDGRTLYLLNNNVAYRNN